MQRSVLKSGLGLLAILRATAEGPQTTDELKEALLRSGLEASGPELYPWLRRLTEEGLITPSLLLDPSGAQVRHYWITREGASQLDCLRPVLRFLGEEGGSPPPHP